MVVKGIKGFVDETQSSSEKWEKVASLMAASAVAKILSDPCIFQDWPHLNAGIASRLNLSFPFYRNRSDFDLSTCIPAHITNQVNL